MQTIHSFNENNEYFTPERCHIVEMLSDKSISDLSIARARVEPGVTTVLHKLKGVTEHYVIISGIGQVKIGDNLPALVMPLDIVNIQPDMPQQITNIGKEDLIFLCICTPHFNEKCYIDLESDK